MLLFLYSCNTQDQASGPVVSSQNFTLRELAAGVYGVIHKFGGKAICNVGVVDNGKETIIFDSFLSPQVAAELLKYLKEMDLSPVRYVINSHSHNDHVRGNQVFPDDVRIISTKVSRDLMEVWEPQDIEAEKSYAPERFAYFDSLYQAFEGDTSTRAYQQILMWRPYYEVLSNSAHEISTRLPDMFVDSLLKLDGPGRRVRLITLGGGHTASDLVMYLPDDHIVYTGDLVFNACHPYVPQGNIADWKNWLQYLLQMEIRVVIPGHGEIGDRSIVQAMLDYLSTLEAMALRMEAEDKSAADVASEPIPEIYKDWWFERFFQSNLKFALDQIAE